VEELYVSKCAWVLSRGWLPGKKLVFYRENLLHFQGVGGMFHYSAVDWGLTHLTGSTMACHLLENAKLIVLLLDVVLGLCNSKVSCHGDAKYQA